MGEGVLRRRMGMAGVGGLLVEDIGVDLECACTEYVWKSNVQELYILSLLLFCGDKAPRFTRP